MESPFEVQEWSEPHYSLSTEAKTGHLVQLESPIWKVRTQTEPALEQVTVIEESKLAQWTDLCPQWRTVYVAVSK